VIAALYVQTGGCYFGLPDVDPWDEPRDARLYDGPHPVVAHPPCARWCQLAPVNQARYGLLVGEDNGCFRAALDAVRKFGGVLEHPALSLAWWKYELAKPPRVGWRRSPCGGFVTQVEQRNYGHPARKATWLYAFGTETPALKWGPGAEPEAWISADRPRSDLAHVRQLSKKESAASPIEFRDLLLSIARTADPRRQAA
jgi:hypothetical protein